MRKSRIISWVIGIIFAILFIVGENFVEDFSKEKSPIKVYAPEDMKEAFSSALLKNHLEREYKITIVEDMSNADIVVDYAKENDKQYSKFAFSPFVVAYNTKDSYYSSLKKSKTLISSEYNKDIYEIDFLKVINEALDEGEWKNLGIKDLEKIKIFYPSKETCYWHDFYDFMLVTINNGKYPTTQGELKNAEEKIQKFEESPYTEAISDFNVKVQRVGGFPTNVFWILPEKAVFELTIENSEYARILYPTNTVYFNYYIKVNDLGNRVIQNAKDSKFYIKLKDNHYRNEQISSISSIDRIYGESDTYNIVDIPEKLATK